MPDLGGTGQVTQDCVLGNCQPSLRDYPHHPTLGSSAVPAGLSDQQVQAKLWLHALTSTIPGEQLVGHVAVDGFDPVAFLG